LILAKLGSPAFTVDHQFYFSMIFSNQPSTQQNLDRTCSHLVQTANILEYYACLINVKTRIIDQ